MDVAHGGLPELTKQPVGQGENEMQRLVNATVVAFTLVSAPVAWASDAHPSGGATVTPAPEAELKALDDTLTWFSQNHEHRTDLTAAEARISRGASATTVTPTQAPEMELKAIDDTLTGFIPNEEREDISTAGARTSRDADAATVTQAPEMELKALDDTLTGFVRNDSRPEPNVPQASVSENAVVRRESTAPTHDCTCMR